MSNTDRKSHQVALLLFMSGPPEPVSRGFHHLYESYHKPLMELLSELNLACALSVPWGLSERWLNDGYHDILRYCSSLRNESPVEFVSTAAYHPILPLLPRDAIARQISHDQARHAEVYGDWSCQGFAPPELAFGPELIPLLQESGFRWCAVDDTTYCCLHGEPPKSHVAKCGDLNLLLRSSLWSKSLVGAARSGGSGGAIAQAMMKGLSDWFGSERGYVFLAVDTECFGRHRSRSLDCLRDFLQTVEHSAEFELVTPSGLLTQFPSRDDEVPPGSWKTTSEQFWEGEFFVPWQSRYVQSHSFLWELTELAVESVSKLQQRLDRNLHSGFFWWDEENHRALPSSAARSLRTLLDVIGAAAPEDLDRALELAARLDEVTP